MTCTGESPNEWNIENEFLLSVTGNGGDGKSESGSEMADSLNVSTKDEDSDGESENSGEGLTDEHAKTPDEQLSVQSSLKNVNNKLLTDDEETSELIDIDGQKLNQVR